ncbi:MAG TPA: isoprenylcysteine carboxylmethyltransferase family protein [Vicinamibacterales bacterium]|jgi:protein-S-isoprenylcysteine O-methyltransferase Ste14|nr:isoprenylcysteine carboxylmethyltransferase family protein [Vicinamibacterales bacterium]
MRTRVADWVARIIVCLMFGALCVNILQEFLRTGHITGLMLLASESLVIVLTLARRRATIVDRSVPAGIVTLVSVAGPPLMRADHDIVALAAPDMLTGIISLLALMLIVSGKLTLGRSFGLVPANRGVVVQGPYSAVRHPIYSGYLVAHVAFLAAHPSTWNVVVFAIADGALIVRALMEERVLTNDEGYRDYCARVSWHLIPGVF